MLRSLKPTFFLNSYQDITPDFLQNNKIKIILSDLDGTLASENEGSDEQFQYWLSNIKDIGVSLIIVSNNKQKRVDMFTEINNLKGFGKCKKPLKNKIKKLTNIDNKEINNTLFLGDQIFTDILCGNIMGVKTAIVKPIPGKETWKTKVKRKPERWLFKVWGENR